jgi:hypothetical protein
VLKDLVDRKVALENEVATVLNLVDGVSAAQVDGLAVFFRKLGAEKPTPVVQSFFGSAQETDRMSISCGFPESHEFGPGGRHALRF